MIATRTWPYGTVKPCEVLTVENSDRLSVVVVKELGGEQEAFILIHSRGAIVAEVGQRGTITFSDGGPTGGWWRWRPEDTGGNS